MPIENRESWMELKLQGWSYGRIAKQAGISRQRVQQILAPPKSIRAIVAKRAGFSCEQCKAPLQKSGHVHHKYGSEDAEHYEDIDNLQYLCQTCHWHAHGHRHETKGPTDVLYIRIPPEVKTRLLQEARARNVSIQSLVEEGIALMFQELDLEES